MSRLASVLIPSFGRPALLWGCLTHWLRSYVPPGWQLEVIVCLPLGDPGRQIIRGMAAAFTEEGVLLRTTGSGRTGVGSQLTAALNASDGELILLSGDDDFHSERRVAAAIDAYLAGHMFSGMERFRFYEWRTGKLAMWEGPAWKSGGMRNYAAEPLRKVSGWGSVPRSPDTEMKKRLSNAGIPDIVHILPEYLVAETICTHGISNITSSRPFPPNGEKTLLMPYVISGLGYLHDRRDVPQHTVSVIGQIEEEIGNENCLLSAGIPPGLTPGSS